MGCHQHYYYYNDPCAPATAVPSSVRSGPVCEVPSEAVPGGTKLADGSTRSTVVTGASTSSSAGTSSRVVVSEPAEQTKVAWRRSDPDATQATTSVKGTINDNSLDR
jgi:hypothetical protein